MTPPDHIGKYVDLNLVGFGTYGSGYRAWDPDLDRYVNGGLILMHGYSGRRYGVDL